MRVKALLSFLFSVALFTVAAGADGQAADTPPSKHAVSTTQLAAWLTGGVPSSRLAGLVAERGLATLPTRNELRQMESAGADKNLMRVLSSGHAESAGIGAPIPEALLKAAAKARQQHFHEAETDVGWLTDHRLLGHVLAQRYLSPGYRTSYRELALFDIVPSRFKIVVQRRKSLDKGPRQLVQELAFEGDLDSGTAPFEKTGA